MFASRRQFHDRQAGTFGEVEDFYTRHCAEPFASDDFPDEYAVQVRPKPLDDHELREQQIKRMLDKDLVTYNEARVMDDHDPVPDGNVPVSLYLKQLEQKLMPQQPPPGTPGEGGEPDAGGEGEPGGGDALAALLGGDATPTGGGPPQPGNGEGEGTLPPQIQKALFLKGFTGEITDKLGRKMHYVDGKRVAGPKVPPAPKAPKGPTKKQLRQDAKAEADREKADELAKAVEVATKLRAGQPITHEDVKALDERLKHLNVNVLKQLNKDIGAKVSVAKAKLIDQAVAHAKALAAGSSRPPSKEAPKAKEKPVETPASPDTPHGKARAALDAMGLDHSHLSDEQAAALHDQIRDLHAKAGGPATAAPAKTPKAKGEGGAKPVAGGGRVDATEKELEAASRHPDAMAGDLPKAEAHADAVLAKVRANHTDDEIRELSRRVAGRKARTAKQGLEYLKNSLTAVTRIIASQIEEGHRVESVGG